MNSTAKYTEDQLIAGLRQRDQEVFSYLYDHYAPALNGVIIRLLDDKELAADILQEAFVKIWNNFGSYDSAKGRLFTWMVNLTRNLTIDTLRSKAYKKQQKIRGDENAVHNLPDNDSVTASFDAIGLSKRLVLLKPDQKKIIDLAYFNGYTQHEISKELDMPLGTVKTKMRAAILELRKHLMNS